MSIVTLESIKTELDRLNQMVSEMETKKLFERIVNQPAQTFTLAPGEHDAGIIIGKNGEPSYRLILLPGEQEKIQWQDAMDWAKSIGGELPNRREQSLLIANLKDLFEPEWYWSSEVHESDSDYAFIQYFNDGNQYCYYEDHEYRARAVRRLVI